MDQNTNELLGIKSIAEVQQKGVVENMKMYLKEAWYFDKAHEKIILVLLSVLGLWKLVGFIF